MAFSAAQVRKLNAAIRRQHVKERQVEGKILHYVEGWHVIAEANRIFGFDAWDRETISSQCVHQKQIDRAFVAAYLTRIRITVRAGGATVLREGLGSGEATAPTSGQAHEWASKAAETDATKRALSTFGNSFGLSLYRGKPEQSKEKKARPELAEARSTDRPGSERQEMERPVACLPVHLPPPFTGDQHRIEKSELALPEPKRLRDQQTCGLWRSSPVSSADAPHRRRTIYGSPSLAPWPRKSAMSLRCRSAQSIIMNCIRGAMRCRGGQITISIPCLSPWTFGARVEPVRRRRRNKTPLLRERSHHLR